LRLPIYGTGHNTREWIHVLDNCRAILKVIELGKPGEIYNIGSGYSISNLELAEKIIKIMQAPKDSLMFVTDRLGHDFRYSINSSKINSMGFKCIENFQNSLEATIEWYIRNPDWFNRRIISK
jgi:dTDP-glucose 4,6-dehydratase